MFDRYDNGIEAMAQGNGGWRWVVTNASISAANRS